MPMLSSPIASIASKVVAALLQKRWVRGSLTLYSIANCTSAVLRATSATPFTAISQRSA